MMQDAGSSEKRTAEKGSFNLSWKTCAKLIISVLIVFLVIRYWGGVESVVGLFLGGLFAVFAGLAVSYILNIPMRFFERKLPGRKGDGTLNRTLAIVASIVCAAAVLLAVGILVIPNLVEAIITLAQAIPEVIGSISENEVLSSLIPSWLLEQLGSIDWDQVISDVVSWLQSGVMSSMPQIMSVVGSIGSWCMGFILMFWFLGEKEKLSASVHKLIGTYIGKGADEMFARAIRVADGCFHGYFVGAALEAVIFGCIVAIVCVIAGIPNAAMLGALVGAMSLIPSIGSYIGAILGAIIILASSWEKALIFFVLFVVIQQVEANFIYPRVVGKHVGLTGMWPLIGVTLGVAVLGFVGAFVGVPLTATIFRIVEADLDRRDQLPSNSATPVEKLQKSLSD